jgi:hypothetical protein
MRRMYFIRIDYVQKVKSMYLDRYDKINFSLRMKHLEA